MVRIERDGSKAESNIRKHGVSFAEAATVLFSPLTYMAANEGGPDRMEYLGYTDLGRLLYVVTDEEEDVVRVISARKANAYEKKKYEEGI